MAKRPTLYGLKQLKAGGDSRAAVVLHGIRQVREDLEPLAQMIADGTVGLNVFVYGYNHTDGLEKNGQALALSIAKDIPHGRVDLVGYSMGGLVARLAASNDYPSRIHTVVTLATPNKGSVSNAELTTLGQLGRSAFEFISPLVARSEGVKDLTRAAKIMFERRNALLKAHPKIQIDSGQRRYVSIPGLFYNIDVADFEFGPSVQMSGLTAALMLTGLRHRLVNMQRPHDGIVTERSNDISSSESHDWSEVHLVRSAPETPPARCHAVIDTCRQHDHLSIVRDPAVAQLIAALLTCDDWRTLRQANPSMDQRVRLYPFDSD